MVDLLLSSSMWLIAFALSVVAYVATTAFRETVSAEVLSPILHDRLEFEVERARRLDYPLILARLVLRPGADVHRIARWFRRTDAVVRVGEDLYVALPGTVRSQADPTFARLADAERTVAAWVIVEFPLETMNYGMAINRLRSEPVRPPDPVRLNEHLVDAVHTGAAASDSAGESTSEYPQIDASS